MSPAARLSRRNMVPRMKAHRLSGSRHWSMTLVQDSFSSWARRELSTPPVRSGASAALPLRMSSP